MNTVYKGILIIILLLIIVYWGLGEKIYVQSNRLEPEIIEYKTFPYIVKDWWLCIPSGENELTVEVRAKNTKEMFFYLTPTGTNTASMEVLIGVSKGMNDVFTIKHKFEKDESILYHFSVDAVSETGLRAKEIMFNIIRCD